MTKAQEILALLESDKFKSEDDLVDRLLDDVQDMWDISRVRDDFERIAKRTIKDNGADWKSMSYGGDEYDELLALLNDEGSVWSSNGDL